MVNAAPGFTVGETVEDQRSKLRGEILGVTQDGQYLLSMIDHEGRVIRFKHPGHGLTRVEPKHAERGDEPSH